MSELKRKIFVETLTQAFDHDRYVRFLKELLNNVQIVAPNKENKPYNTFSAAVDHYRHIGLYEGEDKNKIALFSVCLTNDKNLENARSMQRAFVKSLLDDCAGALVAFHTKNEPDKWRLSLVRLDYEFSKGKLSERLTPAKRYSYLVGKGEPCHTAQERLFPIFVEDDLNPTLDKLEEAFSVEAVTKDFFDQYREKYLELKEFLDSNEDFTAEAQLRGFDSEQFAKKLMGQIVFLYFIQKKGWLGVDAFPAKLTEREYKNGFYRPGRKPKELMSFVYKQGSDGCFYRDNNALLSLPPEDETELSNLVKGDAWGEGPKDFMRQIFDGCIKKEKNFFDDYLEPLFYEGLNENRGENAFFPPLHRRVPFLNGGLFEEMEGYEWRNNDFCIPNDLFSNADTKGRDADGILDVFDRYNFTMAEDEPMEREVAIDPEMLGKVFENLLDVSDRKSKGAFYTPREIVHYMCQETIINYLVTKTCIPEDDIRQFILYGEYFRDEDAKKTLRFDNKTGKQLPNEGLYSDSHMEYDKNKDLVIPETIFSFKKNVNRLPEIDDLLANVKVVDLAVGSGAFPLGMLNEIVKARDTITTYMTIEMNLHRRFVYRSTRSLYRLKRETIKNCIFACDIEASATDITKLRLWLSLVIDNLIMDKEELEYDHTTKPRELPNLDCNIICGNSLIDEFEGVPLFKHNLALDDEHKSGRLATFDHKFDAMINQIIELQSKLYDEKERVAKESLKNQIQELYNQIVVEQIPPNSRVIDDYYQAVQKTSKPFILWQLFFPKVFRDNGGFDIVIGNPPYLGESGHKEIFRPVAATEFGQKFYQGKMDFFYFFFHKGLDLLRNRGTCGLITTNYYLNATGAKTLRRDFRDRGNIVKLVNFNELRIFQTALGQHNIITFLKKEKQGSAECCITERKGFGEANVLHSIVSWKDSQTTYFKLDRESLYDLAGNIVFHKEDSILLKMKKSQNYSFDKKEIGSGIDILQECVVERHLSLNPSLTVGKGIFAIESYEIPDLNLNSFESKVLRPYYTSEQIQKYSVVGDNHKWILYTDKDVCNNIEAYPHVRAHLEQFEDIITSDNAPYGLHRARKLEQFVGEKILSLRMTKEPCFTYANKDTFVTRAYMTIKPINSINLKYLVGLCNSHLFHYWLFNNGKRKGKQLQIDQEQLLGLPICISDSVTQETIAGYVDRITQLQLIDYEYSEIEETINKLVYRIYLLNEEEIERIENFIIEQREEK